jgi:hypothetical protein
MKRAGDVGVEVELLANCFGRLSRHRVFAEQRRDRPHKGFVDSTIKENMALHDSKLANNAERRCVGTNSQGEQCRRFAIPGGRVCKFHGGATRHVTDKARIRVEMSSYRLMGKLIEIAFDDTRPSSVQLDAIKDSLTRAGMTKPAQVEVGPIKPHEEVFDDITSGARADYRAGVGNDDQTSGLDDLYASGQITPRDYYGPEDVDYQRDSYPAPA